MVQDNIGDTFYMPGTPPQSDTRKDYSNTAINPAHYKKYPVEVIDMMIMIFGKKAVIAHSLCTALKYRMRMGEKEGNPMGQDLEKERWYLNKARELKNANRKCYIAGPISVLHDDINEAVKLAKPQFDLAKQWLVLHGLIPVSPMDSDNLASGKDWVDYMEKDIPILKECDAIYMLKGWDKSKGARIELAIAKADGMDILYQD